MGDFKILKTLFQELIREEKRGYRFFLDAAKYVENSRVRRLFQHLAAEESQHLETLNKAWKRIEINHAAGAEETERFGSKAQVIEYAGVEHPVFVVDTQSVSSFKLPKFELFKVGDFQTLIENVSLEHVMKFAMKIEYDNTQYIVGFMKHLKDKRNIELLKKMAQEEKNHFLMLKQLYEDLKDLM